MGFEKMEPIFGELKAEFPGLPEKDHLRNPFLFLIRALPNELSTLSIQITNFHSHTWEALKTQSQLEDMRDGIGIGGTWSDFVEYFIASIKSEDVKLVIDGQSKSGGAAHAKLIAQKGKGMPRIVISLSKLVDSAANEAISNISLELYRAYSKVHTSLINEEKHRCELANILSAEQEKKATLQRQLDAMFYSRKQKVQKISKQFKVQCQQKPATVLYQPIAGQKLEEFFCKTLKMIHTISSISRVLPSETACNLEDEEHLLSVEDLLHIQNACDRSFGPFGAAPIPELSVIACKPQGVGKPTHQGVG